MNEKQRMTTVSIKAMLDDLMLEIDLETVKYSEDFIKSLNDQFKQKGILSDKQEIALRKVYKSVMA